MNDQFLADPPLGNLVCERIRRQLDCPDPRPVPLTSADLREFLRRLGVTNPAWLATWLILLAREKFYPLEIALVRLGSAVSVASRWCKLRGVYNPFAPDQIDPLDLAYGVL